MALTQKIFTFLIIPVAVVILLVINAWYVADNYLGQESSMAQYNASIELDSNDIEANTGEVIKVDLNVRNEGTITWLSSTNEGIFLSHRIKSQFSDRYIIEGDRIPFPEAVKPGDSLDMSILIDVPPESGIYHVSIDIVHESVTWFEDVGSEVGIIKLNAVN